MEEIERYIPHNVTLLERDWEDIAAYGVQVGMPANRSAVLRIIMSEWRELRQTGAAA